MIARSRLGSLKAAVVIASLALVGRVHAQTFQVGSDSPKTSQAPAKQGQEPSLGWGSNIQNARLARAAELALEQGRHAEALEMAQRAAQAAPNDPQLWFLLGYAARLNGKYPQSVDAYKKGLHLNPSSLDGQSGLAQVYNLTGRTDEAASLLKQVVTADPKRADDALLLGDMYLRSRNAAEAVNWLLKAERMRASARSELLLALAYQQTNQADLANKYLELAEHRDPNNPEVQRSMAGYFRDVGKYADAITALKSIRNPKPDVVAELAYTYQLDGKPSESATLYAQAANAAPKDLNLQLSAAQAEVAAGFTAKASSFLTRAAGIDQRNYRLHAIRAQIEQLQDHSHEAVTEYTAAIANLPVTPPEGPLYSIQLHMDLMSLYQKIGDEDGARRELATARAAIGSLDSPGTNRAAFLRLRALIRSNSGELDGALADINEALTLNTSDPASMQLDGDILMKLGKTEDAINVYKKILDKDPDNRFALTSLGYASRAAGRDQDAEKYFEQLEQADPSLYVPYLALGDLYAARRDYSKAQVSYEAGFKHAPQNALVVAGGMNAAIESHNLQLAKQWLDRVTSDMLAEPQVLREKERYLSFAGNYRESETVGEQAIAVLPKDRDVVVYLGYDLLHLGRYDDLLALTTKYRNVLTKEPDIPLLQGYVHKHQGQSELARVDFTEVLERDPEVVTAYVNRGYMLNDLHQPGPAAADFEAALTRDPNDGEAHLGLAYANLDLSRPQAAVRQADLAEKLMGDMRDVHVIRATAYAREELLTKAAGEYRAALRFTPNDGGLHLGLGSALFSQRRYNEAIEELAIAEKYSPEDPNVDAMLARSYASLDDRDKTMEYIRAAETHAQSKPTAERCQVFLSTGEALSTLGDRAGALDRFKMALDAPEADRIGVRLAIAQLMAQQEKFDDADRQIALGWMEAAAGDAPAPTATEYIAAADVLRSTHDYTLSQNYLERAKAAGAPDVRVRVGMANNYLALGDTARAHAELAAVSAEGDDAADYQFLIAEANVFRQEHQGAQALTSFAQAANSGGQDDSAEQEMLQASADEGYRVTPTLSLLSDFSIDPIFEDSTVYVLDSKVDATFPISSTNPGLLPPPRSSLQTQWTDAFHLHLGRIPTPAGFFQLRNARGNISVPATNSIVNRNTTDYAFNIGLNPIVHLGSNVAVFNGGVQETLRRDSLSPLQMNQNLFRIYGYMSTSSFFNALSFSGFLIRETGPFTEIPLSSQQVTGALDFRVGKPWGKTALVTGWGSSAQRFTPSDFENYYTSSYIGLERKFGEKLNVRAVVEDVRSWRTQNGHSGTAQNLRPAGTVEFAPKRNWELKFSSAYSSTRDFHIYDASQNSFSVSYSKPFQRKFNDDSGDLPIKYPIRFSAGIQQESFFNFPGSHSEQFRPYVQISVF
ncbi:MAG TPA: tetratricopeptide repeat protein [Terracidiphilus sp.]|nr:tetratricopeptide repeat protein [Terracidiphilus sp.]